MNSWFWGYLIKMGRKKEGACRIWYYAPLDASNFKATNDFSNIASFCLWEQGLKNKIECLKGWNVADLIVGSRNGWHCHRRKGMSQICRAIKRDLRPIKCSRTTEYLCASCCCSSSNCPLNILKYVQKQLWYSLSSRAKQWHSPSSPWFINILQRCFVLFSF